MHAIVLVHKMQRMALMTNQANAKAPSSTNVAAAATGNIKPNNPEMRLPKNGVSPSSSSPSSSSTPSPAATAANNSTAAKSSPSKKRQKENGFQDQAMFGFLWAGTPYFSSVSLKSFLSFYLRQPHFVLTNCFLLLLIFHLEWNCHDVKKY